VLRESLRLVTIRYQRGITNELDVALATRELATLEAQIAPVEAQVEPPSTRSRCSSASIPRT
jgi:outer membrane protein TolC